MAIEQSFETERLILQPTTEDDADFILEILNTPKWIEFIGDRKVHTLDDARNYIRVKIRPQIDRLGFGNFTIIRKKEKDKIGSCGLFDREGLEGLDIGFALLPGFEGKGYAREAATKIKELAINHFHLKEIKAITTKTNYSSQQLLEKLGLHRSGTVTMPGEDEELLLYHMDLQPH